MSPKEDFKIFLDEVMPESKARMYSPLTLAFLGDAVYSLLVRQMLSFALFSSKVIQVAR